MTVKELCGRFLVEASKKKIRSSYICQEFAAHLYTVFAINTSNGIVNTHPPWDKNLLLTVGDSSN